MIVKFPQIDFIYDRRKKASSDRKASVEIRISYNYKQKYISTGIMLYPNQWKNGKIVNCTDILELTQTLDSLISDVRQIVIDMSKQGYIDIMSISDKLERLHSGNISFTDFCIQRAEIRKYGKSADSQARYDRFIRMFTRWGGIKEFDDINEQNIIAYDKYLNQKGLKPYSKWNNYHRFLNSFILDAIDAGHLKKNPYRWVRIEKEKSSTGIGKYLSPEEFRRIKKATMPTRSLERVRDLFVFQTYTCFSYSDMKDFNPELIQTVKGVKVYIGSRKKTGKTFTIPLLLPAIEILNKYNRQLPIISNVKYNEYLKIVAQTAGIDRPVSSHWARHTGATLLLNEGIEMKVISKICGHSSIRITEQIYAKLLDETVVDAISNIHI